MASIFSGFLKRLCPNINRGICRRTLFTMMLYFLETVFLVILNAFSFIEMHSCRIKCFLFVQKKLFKCQLFSNDFELRDKREPFKSKDYVVIILKFVITTGATRWIFPPRKNVEWNSAILLIASEMMILCQCLLLGLSDEIVIARNQVISANNRHLLFTIVFVIIKPFLN